MTCQLPKSNSSIIYFQNSDNIWYLKISKDGAEFNLKAFPDWTPDDFALEFMKCISKSYPQLKWIEDDCPT